MKRIKRHRVAIIQEKTAGLYEDAINAKLDELAEHKPELIIESVEKHTAYIRYAFDEYVPEDMADRFNLLGVKYYCRDCAYCEFTRNKDGSIRGTTKKGHCSRTGKQIIVNMEACNTFYYELASRSGQFANGAELPADALRLLEEHKIAADHHDDR